MKKNRDFRTVYQNGKSMGSHRLVLYVLANGTERNRVGISVSKKVGNSVVRHHLTRLVRESYRLHEQEFDDGLDLVWIVRPRAKESNFFQIESAMMYLAGKAHVLKKV